LNPFYFELARTHCKQTPAVRVRRSPDDRQSDDDPSGRHRNAEPAVTSSQYIKLASIGFLPVELLWSGLVRDPE